MIRGEADHPADAAGALAAHQRIVALRCIRRIAHQRGKVVGEHKGAGVVRVFIAGHAGIAGAEEAVGIVRWQGLLGRRLLRALPRTLGTMGRNQDPLSGQRIVSAMGVIDRVKLCHRILLNPHSPAGDGTASARCPAPSHRESGSPASSALYRHGWRQPSSPADRPRDAEQSDR